MRYVEFDETRPMDLILLGRVAIDFNPSEDEPFGPLENVRTFKKYVGGSPANIAVGVTRHGLKAGFLGKVSDDKFGKFVVDFFNKEGIDTSHITKCTNGKTRTYIYRDAIRKRKQHPDVSKLHRRLTVICR